MANNEKTGKRVSTIAGAILERLANVKATPGGEVIVYGMKFGEARVCTVAELKALAASALTQTADKKKTKP